MAEIINAMMRSIGAILRSFMKLVGGIAKAIEKGIAGTIEVIVQVFKGMEKALRSIVNPSKTRWTNIPKPNSTRKLVSIDCGRTRKIEVKVFQSDVSDLLKDQTINMVMQKFIVTQPEQSLVNILYVGGRAGAEAGYIKYQKTGDMSRAVRIARNEAIVGATGQAIREIPNFADGGNPMINYAEERICNKAADKAEHELRKELASRK